MWDHLGSLGIIPTTIGYNDILGEKGLDILRENIDPILEQVIKARKIKKIDGKIKGIFYDMVDDREKGFILFLDTLNSIVFERPTKQRPTPPPIPELTPPPIPQLTPPPIPSDFNTPCPKNIKFMAGLEKKAEKELKEQYKDEFETDLFIPRKYRDFSQEDWENFRVAIKPKHAKTLKIAINLIINSSPPIDLYGPKDTVDIGKSVVNQDKYPRIQIPKHSIVRGWDSEKQSWKEEVYYHSGIFNAYEPAREYYWRKKTISGRDTQRMIEKFKDLASQDYLIPGCGEIPIFYFHSHGSVFSIHIAPIFFNDLKTGYQLIPRDSLRRLEKSYLELTGKKRVHDEMIGTTLKLLCYIIPNIHCETYSDGNPHRITLRKMVEIGMIPLWKEKKKNKIARERGELAFQIIEKSGFIFSVGTADRGFRFFHSLGHEALGGIFLWKNRKDLTHCKIDRIFQKKEKA